MMKELFSEGLFLGVDGCKGGWIAAVLDHGELRIKFTESIEELTARYPHFDAFLIDMVIGLQGSSQMYRPDHLARMELKPRTSTVFPAPSRVAVEAEGPTEQRKANRSALDKSLSAQTINIIPKIKELDQFLDSHPEYKNRILESHPELVFKRLKGSVVMTRKKDRAGIEEREAILRSYLQEIYDFSVMERAKELGCKPDDILDAVCLAVAAALAAHNMCETLPKNPEKDEKGLYMMLTVPKKICPCDN